MSQDSTCVHQYQIKGIAERSYNFGRPYTLAMYVCRVCGLPTTETIQGTWTLEQLATTFEERGELPGDYPHPPYVPFEVYIRRDLDREPLDEA